jgi:DNA-binding XRE family transcriptional regulator
MITAAQLRAARGLLDWTRAELAKAAGISPETIKNIEHGTFKPQDATAEAIEKAFAAHYVVFLEDEGVRKKGYQIVTLEGENVFFRVLDDVIATMRNKPKAEALFTCVNDRLSPQVVIENYRRLRKEGIGMRSLVKEGDTYFMGDINEYRYLPSEFFVNTPQIIYGDKIATMLYSEGKNQEIIKSALIARNAYAAEAQRNLFNFIWSVAEKPEKTEATVFYDK